MISIYSKIKVKSNHLPFVPRGMKISWDSIIIFAKGFSKFNSTPAEKYPLKSTPFVLIAKYQFSLLDQCFFFDRMDEEHRKTNRQRKEEFKFITWARSDVSTCTCPDLNYRHSHCPCESCNGRAVSSSTEYIHWEKNNILAR